MAVFLINICKFNGCGITFPSLSDLIQHIEDTHIDYDPKVIERREQSQPACVPLSYVLRFITDTTRKDGVPFISNTAAELKRKLAIKHHSYSMSSSNRSNTPTGSEMDEDEMVVSESEDSNDSWTTEEFSSEFIMRYGSRHSGNTGNGNEKPFACPVPGCKKRYKNVNGIKYHSKNGHKKDGKVRKGFKCHCGKSYKTAQGLKSHSLVTHNSAPENINSTGIQAMRSVSPSQSAGSLSPSSISNLSGSSGISTNTNFTQQSPTSNNTIAAPNQISTTSNLLRSNIGLISIKTTKQNLVATNMGGNKILKLTSEHDGNKIKFETPTKMAIPGLVNLGILTPANSPKIQQHAYQQSTTAIITATNGTSNGNSNCSINSNNHDSLPMTPVSPNILRTAAVSAASNSVAFNHSSGGGNCQIITEDT